MIKLVLSDVDGVLTDGKVWVNSTNDSFKCLNYKDFDAVALLRSSGIKFGIITGEENHFTVYVKRKFQPNYFVSGCKEKYKTILEIAKNEGVTLKEICYIGDGKYDIEAISKVGLGLCPKDAIEEVRKVADIAINRKGGEGCLAEVYTLLSAEMKDNSNKG